MTVLHVYIDKSHVNIIMLHVDIIRSHVNIIYLACIGGRSMPPYICSVNGRPRFRLSDKRHFMNRTFSNNQLEFKPFPS